LQTQLQSLSVSYQAQLQRQMLESERVVRELRDKHVGEERERAREVEELKGKLRRMARQVEEERAAAAVVKPDEEVLKRVAVLERSLAEERAATEEAKAEGFKERSQSRKVIEEREEALWRLQKAQKEISELQEVLAQSQTSEGQLADQV